MLGKSFQKRRRLVAGLGCDVLSQMLRNLSLPQGLAKASQSTDRRDGQVEPTARSRRVRVPSLPGLVAIGMCVPMCAAVEYDSHSADCVSRSCGPTGPVAEPLGTAGVRLSPALSCVRARERADATVRRDESGDSTRAARHSGVGGGLFVGAAGRDGRGPAKAGRERLTSLHESGGMGSRKSVGAARLVLR